MSTRPSLDCHDVALFFSYPDAAQHECCEPGLILLCMGLFSRFCVQAPITLWRREHAIKKPRCCTALHNSNADRIDQRVTVTLVPTDTR